MSRCLLEPTDCANWRVDARTLFDRLQLLYPNARMEILQNHTASDKVFSWTITWNHHPMICILFEDRRTMSLLGPIERCIEIALLYRELVPPEANIFFALPDMSRRIVLESGMVIPNIMAAFEPDFAPLEWEVLLCLQAMGGRATANALLNALRARHPVWDDADSLQQVDAAISSLWRAQCISSPSERWALTIPEDIQGFLVDSPTNDTLFTLTGNGVRALKIRALRNT